MKAIKKLKIIFKLAMLSALIPFFLLMFKNNIKEGIILTILLIAFILFRRIFFRDRKINYENYKTVSFHYIYGITFLFLAVIFSLYTLLDLRRGNTIPLWGILALFGFWTFGILITYYTYQAKKESVLKKT